MFDSHGRQVSPLIELAAGRSVYALDVAVDVCILAFGTRDGHVQVLQVADSNCAEASPSGYRWDVGAPVLSVCISDTGHIITSDKAGRCLVWDATTPKAPPSRLECGGRTICSLRRIADGTVAGLASDGQMLRWIPLTGELISSVAGRRPPRPVALVDLGYWATQNTLFCPADDGDLVLWNLDKDHVTVNHVHDGGFFVADVAGEQLLTVGRHDGRVICWSVDGTELIPDTQRARRAPRRRRWLRARGGEPAGSDD